MKRELELKYRTILQQQLKKGVITKRYYNSEIKYLRNNTPLVSNKAHQDIENTFTYKYLYKEKRPQLRGLFI